MSRHRRAKLRCHLLPSSRYLQLGKRGLNQRKLNRKTMLGDARQPLGVGRQPSGPRGGHNEPPDEKVDSVRVEEFLSDHGAGSAAAGGSVAGGSVRADGAKFVAVVRGLVEVGPRS